MEDDSLVSFAKRLRDLCDNYGDCNGPERREQIRNQAQHALAVAAEFGLLREPDFSWSEFLGSSEGANIGTEHMVELDTASGLVGKTTIPPGFGVIPEVQRISVAVANPDSEAIREREAIEFVDATPLEYLSRWMASNEIFGDDVRLVSVIRWCDGMISFGITQPQYHGVPAEPRDIEQFFNDAGWSRLKDPSGHMLFFNYAYAIMAIDAAKRNCYINKGGLQPFDVILCSPNEKMNAYLGIYPE